MEYIVNLNLSEYLLLFQILGVYLGVEFQTHPIMNIKRNIIFALESRKKNGVPIVENVPIRMRVIYASQRIEFTTGYRIDVAKWDADKQRVKNGCTNKLKQSASEINADLLKYYTEIQNVFKEFEVQEAMPTTKQLKDAFNLRMKDTSEDQEDVKISFWEVFDEFVKECGNQNNWTESTYEKFAAVKNHLKEFKEDVTFEYFDEFGLNEYVNILRTKRAKQLLEETTLSVSEIAGTVGYESITYFEKVFKTYMSISPLKYRKTLNGITYKNKITPEAPKQ